MVKAQASTDVKDDPYSDVVDDMISTIPSRCRPPAKTDNDKDKPHQAHGQVRPGTKKEL
jgi:hypothetical protein